MKKTHTVRTFLAGALAALLLAGIVPSALAAAGVNITVWPGISVYIDDQKLEPKDANGNPVMVFTYNGTTYLPVRAISEALGKPVQWEGSTNSVYVGQHKSSKPAAWLSQMDYFSGTAGNQFKTAATEQDNTGTVHTNCITESFDRTYLLNGQYSKITGTLYQCYAKRSEQIIDGDGGGVYLYGDGNLLFAKTYSKGTAGIQPYPFEVDLTGVLELRVVFADGDWYSYEHRLSLGDVALWT